jgi:hypothetical protein
MAQLLTLKGIVSQASLELGITLTPVAAVVGSLDQDIVQMASLLHVVADELLLDEPYRTTLGDGVWAMATDEATPKPGGPTLDSDLILFDGRLAIDGLKFRFLQAKGLEFGEQMRDFTNRLNKLAGRANARVLDLDAEEGRSA